MSKRLEDAVQLGAMFVAGAFLGALGLGFIVSIVFLVVYLMIEIPAIRYAFLTFFAVFLIGVVYGYFHPLDEEGSP